MKKKTPNKVLIKPFKKSFMKKLSLTLQEIQEFKKFNYILIIKSIISKSIRITLYPLENRSVFKLKIKDSTIFDDMLHKLLEFLKHYEVIHTSGLIEIEKKYLFECYFKLDLNSPKLNELEIFINNIKKSSTFFKIEKIKFKR